MRKRPTILVVEDDPHSAEILRRILPRWGYQVEVTHTIEAARKAAAAGSFDLLLSDLVLPDGNGADLCRQLRETRNIPAIAVTGYTLPATTADGQHAGFDRQLTKPVDMDLLYRAIEKSLAQSSGTTSLSSQVASENEASQQSYVRPCSWSQAYQ